MDEGTFEPSIPILSTTERKRIEETNYGRDAGWIMEYKNQAVALLTNCQFYDMFWDLYDVTYLTEDEAVLAQLQDQFFWYENLDDVVFRNCEFKNLFAAYPIISIDKDTPYSIVARGLYLWIDAPPTKSKRTWTRSLPWLWSDIVLTLLTIVLTSIWYLASHR